MPIKSNAGITFIAQDDRIGLAAGREVGQPGRAFERIVNVDQGILQDSEEGERGCSLLLFISLTVPCSKTLAV